MDFINDLLLKRESCRSYTTSKVDIELLKQICLAGSLSPSACNSQPWSFHIVSSEEKVKDIIKATQTFGFNKFTSNVSSFIVIAEEKANLTERVGSKIGNKDFMSIDIGIATHAMVLEATSLNLSTCILGLFNQKLIQKTLNITKKPRLIIAVGYPTNITLRKKSRKNIDDILSIY